MTDHTGLLRFQRKDIESMASFCVVKYPPHRVWEDPGFLHETERKYINKLKADKRILSYLGGRYAAKKAVSTLTGEPALNKIIIERGVFEFPVVHYPYHRNIQVSISHAGCLAVALAFSEAHPVSIDIELIQQEKEATLMGIIPGEEIVSLGSETLTNVQKLILLWTMKESLSKILKTGLMTDFKLYEINKIENVAGSWVGEFTHFTQYKCVSILSGEYGLSVALPRLSHVSLSGLHSSLNDLVVAKAAPRPSRTT